MLATLALTLLGYLLGSLPFGLWVGRALTGRDIRAGGSGHSGATNTMRQAGWAAGVLVLALDLAKGFAAAWLARRFGPYPWAAAAATAAVVAGHCWPVWAGFRGGMGMATAGGALLAIWPLAFAIGIGLAAAGSLALRHSARGNTAAALLLPGVLWLITRDLGVALVALAAGLVIAARAAPDWGRVYRELWLDRR